MSSLELPVIGEVSQWSASGNWNKSGGSILYYADGRNPRFSDVNIHRAICLPSGLVTALGERVRDPPCFPLKNCLDAVKRIGTLVLGTEAWERVSKGVHLNSIVPLIKSYVWSFEFSSTGKQIKLWRKFISIRLRWDLLVLGSAEQSAASQ
ncbi:hypothetical protein CC1G_14679 [Coprinopsis cinerea okayama7|uniref:Uncharacterized protein n=1 Tax=Coprinopsis cinerea (strain Okayama-7 / 130 / ATCC MYA-4618 / FGSC 9003) TaxID=240176 RepID=D6RMZ4_COPC7|nr:hypothetical protein CC1G_14679 [Coprinopsis cinerea okayama7\|eukprot:XP_002911250.1 hypothetical protein CC1G_14679 [Coprinopsis cinerea okayama7\